MEWKINPNAANQLIKGTQIFTEGEPVYSIALVLKGRVLIHNNGAKVIAGSGTFLGVNDLYTGKYQSTYTALDDLLIYAFSVNQQEQLEQILSINNDYHGFMVASNSRFISELDQIYQGIRKSLSNVFEFLTKSYADYLDMGSKLGYRVKTLDKIANLSMPMLDLDILEDRINYYLEFKNLPMDVVKAFYSYGNDLTLYQVKDQVSIINQQMEILKDLSDGLIAMLDCLFNDTENCFFQLIANLILEISKEGGDNQELFNLMDRIIDEVNHTDVFINSALGTKYTINRNRMEEIYNLLLKGSKGTNNIKTFLKYPEEDANNAEEELNQSYQKILDYAEMKPDKAESMINTMLDFINLKDRLSPETDARLIRKKLSSDFYEIYLKVFIKAYHSKRVPKVIDMFLKYGYADERLLTKEQLLSLYFLKDTTSVDAPFGIYNIKEWLTLIYEGKKEPSKNEFDMEYPEFVNSLKKQATINEKEAKDWLVNPIRKIEYEIKNMFAYNNRTTNGQITTFVPVLHKDMLASDFERLYVTPDRIVNAVQDLLEIDYSIFDREVIYSNEEKKIVKEYMIKRVYPDFILMPTVGNHGIMWQEITGKKRDSSGRFLFPIFTDADLYALMVRVFGRFRWEMCRTIEGTAWNDIKHKSLTSEYSDYLQFYRKNKDLTEERKEKLKAQIQKGRNNSREIFVMDYEQWIGYEAKGALKLNRPVREILATYCPFAKPIREKIKAQPLFEEAMARYYRDKQKKIREIESRHRYLEKDRIEIPQELLDTLEYYKES